MRRLLTALIALFVLSPAGVVAQAPVPSSAAPAPPPATAAEVAIDPTAMGVSISRISRRLQADAVARTQGDAPLKLEYFVDVYGTAPELRFFIGQDLVYGAVPGSAPTHSDMIYQLTPQAFRSPTVDILGLAYAAASAGVRKVDDWRYQRDLRAYQKLIESGRNLPAPQPPRR
jgi:hypothetical protein